MTDKEILNYNKRCAEFLGYVNITPTDKDFNIYEKKDCYSYIPNEIELISMKFHSDWNWIMEVIQEIRRLVFPLELEKIVFRKWEALVNALGLTDKQIVAERLNEFLIWYNKLKK